VESCDRALPDLPAVRCCALRKETGSDQIVRTNGDDNRAVGKTQARSSPGSHGDIDRRRANGREAAGRMQQDLQESHFAVHALDTDR